MIRVSKEPVRNNEQDISRPFDTAILGKAREIAGKYRIVLEPHPDGGYIGTSLEMPGAIGRWANCRRVRETCPRSLVVGVAYLLESGQAPPVPAGEQIRNKQINIRVTESEQRRLKEAAAAKGFTDISDFMRTTLLGH